MYKRFISRNISYKWAQAIEREIVVKQGEWKYMADCLWLFLLWSCLIQVIILFQTNAVQLTKCLNFMTSSLH